MEKVLVDASIYPRITRFLYYIFGPALLAFFMTPGLIWSYPAAANCSDGLITNLAPGRVTYKNTAVAWAVWIGLTVLWFYFGAKGAIPFPFTVNKYTIGLTSK
jgi:hypothetical protein